MIRNPTPRSIALSTAFLVALLVGGLTSFIQSSWEQGLWFFLLTLVLSFVLFYYALEIFIYRKIKLIYKNIHRLKTTRQKSTVFNKASLTSDPISEVNQEVILWAKDQNAEIEELKKLENFRKEFLGNVSHELKTPIFNIQGYIHTLIDGAIDDPEVNVHFLKKAAKSVDRLCDLVEDLINISQLETGQLKMEMEKFDIHALVKDIFESLEMKAMEREISLNFKEGCDQPFFVYADKYRIRQVLVNLIVNSIKYGKDGGHTFCAFYDMDENILVEISDNGEGIAEKHLPRLFERFYRVDKSRSREAGGNGLGLAIVKHIIEAHDQSINVRSKIGAGTTFGFTLKKGVTEPKVVPTLG
ncbi:MAG: sensor histidine kinase [Bacteroidetes bacterium]|nr:sensor histidine kinase [Bacteroidota bacterium]